MKVFCDVVFVVIGIIRSITERELWYSGNWRNANQFQPQKISLSFFDVELFLRKESNRRSATDSFLVAFFLFLHDRALAMRCYGSTNMSAKNVMTKSEEVYAARDAKIFPSEPWISIFQSICYAKLVGIQRESSENPIGFRSSRS